MTQFNYASLMGPSARTPGISPLGDTLAQASNPQAVASQAQPSGGMMGGIGEILQRIQDDPHAQQALLAAGAQLLNPTTFGSSGGRIAQVATDGVQGYNAARTASADKAYQRGREKRAEGREDRKLEQGDEAATQGRQRIDLEQQRIDQNAEQFEAKMGMSEREFDKQMAVSLKKLGLEGEKLKQQSELYKAQAYKYGAEANALMAKTANGGADLEKLTGPERIINRLANVVKSTGVDDDLSYVTAFSIYNDSQGDEAKALASIDESLGFLASEPESKAQLDAIKQQAREAFISPVEQIQQLRQEGGQGAPAQPAAEQAQEVAPGVTQQDIQAALTSMNAREGGNISWEALTPQQQQVLIQRIQQVKGGAQ